MGRRKKGDQILLTDFELTLMNIIWELGEASVHDILEKLPPEENYAYNTISTVVRLLEQKKILKSKKVGKGHSYTPLLKKEKYESIGLTHMIENVFQGTPLALIKRLIDDQKLTPEELNEAKRLLDERTQS